MIARAAEQRVTIVVLTHDRADVVCDTVARLLALPERPAVLVVDNGSTDGTPRRLRDRFPGVAVVSLAVNMGAAGRNAGVRRATTPYVAFCDDDTWWETGSLGRAADILDGVPRLALVTGRLLVGPDDHEDPACRRMAQSPLPHDDNVPGFPLLGFLPEASVARRDAVLEVGGFERHFYLCGEERLLAADLAARGWAIAYVPEIVAHHQPQPAPDAIEREWLRIRNGLWFAWLRRPAGIALRETLRVARAARHDALSRRALREAVAELPWIWRRRAVLPQRVEQRLRVIERAVPA